MTTLTLDQYHDLTEPTRSAVVDWLRHNDLTRVIVFTTIDDVVSAHRYKTDAEGKPYLDRQSGTIPSETVTKTSTRPCPLDAPQLYTLDGQWRGAP